MRYPKVALRALLRTHHILDQIQLPVLTSQLSKPVLNAHTNDRKERKVRVSEILNKKGGDVITIRPNAILAQAIDLLISNKIGSVPVCEPGGAIVGLLTERDILHGLANHGTSIMVMQVEELMSKKVYHCAPDDNLKHVMSVMTEKHVRHLLVMVDNQLSDIVSIGDVVKSQLEESQLEVDVLRDYARSH